MNDNLSVILFETEEEWADWLENNTGEAGVWVRIAKKDSGVISISYQQAVDIGLCYGWIDGQKQSYDGVSYLQRFTPRKPKSNWSKINKEKVIQFISEGRMKPAGLVSIENAKKSGAWDKAYDPQSSIEVPEDFKNALNENPVALEFFRTLNRINRYAILYRIQTSKTEKSRFEKIEKFVAMLANHKKIYN